MRIIMIILSLLIFTIWNSCNSAVLPRWVYRVDSCPDPRDINQWINASKAINCHHDLTSNDPNEQALVYHCIPSIYLNETVEFCGKSIPVAPGYCPIYNYGAIVATYYSCSDFTSGCPLKMFHSKKVYQHPVCLEINRISRCYKVQANCSMNTTTISSKAITENRQKGLASTTSVYTYIDEKTTNEDSVAVITTMSDSLDSIHDVIIYIAVPLVVLVVASVAIVIFRKRIIGHCKYLISKPSGIISDDDVLGLSTWRVGNVQTTIPETRSVESSGYSETCSMENEHSNCDRAKSSNESDQYCSLEGLNGRLENVQNTVSETHSDESSGYSETGSVENEHLNGNRATSSNESDRHCSQEGLNGRLGNVQNTVSETHSVQSSGYSETEQAGYHESAERLSLLDNMFNGATMGQYNILLRSLAKHITPKVFHRIKAFVKDRREVNDNDLEEIKGPEELLDYLDKKYLVLNNIVYLQGLFLACKAPHLYDRCLEYAKKRGKEITYFEAKILKSDHTKVKYVINCPNISEYKISELEKLRSTVATLIHANFDDILVSGVKNGCVIVTMMIRNCLIPTLKTHCTSEKLSMTGQSLKYRIIKVMIRDEIVYPPDILSNAAGLAAEEKLSRLVLQSSSEAQIEISKTNDLKGTISSTLECKQKTENVEDGVLSKAVEITPKNAHAKNDFTSFLESIGGRITDDTWHFMKILLHDFVDHECVGKMNPSKMLNELANMLKLEYNMSFLEWIFDECGENKLAKECLEFSAENQFPLECFNTNYTPCGESQPFEIQLMVFELETYRDELQDLRYWLAKTIHVHPGQILMTALRNGPVVVTFLVREKHGNAVLEYLRTDDGQIAASRKRIEKIVQNGNVIEIGKALNGSNFVQIRLRLRENSSGIHAALRNLASIILRRTGISMEGSEIYTRTVPCDKKRNEANAGPVKEESFIKKNRNLILEEIELREIENSAIADLFDEEKLASMRKIKGRRDQAKYFLKLCESLPEEERERACSYLKKRTVSLPEEKSNHEELSSIKKCIQQNKENILDEIDSDFIESTIDRMEDAPEEFKTAWSDPNKSRKERATIFLDFALQKDEYIRALKDLMDEKGIKDPE